MGSLRDKHIQNSHYARQGGVARINNEPRNNEYGMAHGGVGRQWRGLSRNTKNRLASIGDVFASGMVDWADHMEIWPRLNSRNEQMRQAALFQGARSPPNRAAAGSLACSSIMADLAEEPPNAFYTVAPNFSNTSMVHDTLSLASPSPRRLSQTSAGSHAFIGKHRCQGETGSEYHIWQDKSKRRSKSEGDPEVVDGLLRISHGMACVSKKMVIFASQRWPVLPSGEIGDMVVAMQ